MTMTLGTLDRRTLVVLAGGILAVLVLRFGVYRDAPAPVVAPAESIPTAEGRLERLRQLAATVPGKQSVLKQAQAELDARQAGMLQADTAAQAGAQLLDIIRQTAMANGIDARGAEELREARPLGNDYGEVAVTESFNCQIEQLVNFLAQLANEPVATREIHINSLNDKKKTVQVRLSISGVVPKKLVPVKKVGAF